MTVLLWLGLFLVVLGLMAVCLTVFGERRWAADVLSMQADLERGQLENKPGPVPLATRYDVRELEGLPAPAQRYFCAVLKDGQPVHGPASWPSQATPAAWPAPP